MSFRERIQTRQKRPRVQTLFASADQQEMRHSLLPIPVLPNFSDLHELQEWLAFAGQFFADFRTTASVVPSSPHLAREMVLPLRSSDARVVLEFGPGTGPMTSLILEAIAADGHLYSFEVNSKFVSYLSRNFHDSRLHVVEAGAQHAGETLAAEGHPHADAVVSSLPLSFFPSELREAVLTTAARSLRPGGVFTQFQYASGLDCSGRFPKPYELRPLLSRHFSRIERTLVWMNFPPAWVYRCYVD